MGFWYASKFTVKFNLNKYINFPTIALTLMIKNLLWFFLPALLTKYYYYICLIDSPKFNRPC